VEASCTLSSQLDDVYHTSPANLTSTVVLRLGRSQLPSSVTLLSDRLTYYNNRLTEYLQAQALQRLDRGK
jgi:hypothetical protein